MTRGRHLLGWVWDAGSLALRSLSAPGGLLHDFLSSRCCSLLDIGVEKPPTMPGVVVFEHMFHIIRIRYNLYTSILESSFLTNAFRRWL